ncbi:hypothetical protein TDB9533_04091 [Thalassocella blandensis]|nr:hypothetical protein TDB9533_04091 [Thalassocella blandensis]
MNKVSKLIGIMLVVFPIGMATSISYAENYYRWKDANGQIHYGSRPPVGVEAEKVKTYGGRSSATETNSSAETSENPDETGGSADVDTQKIAAEQKKQCDQERQRLATLKSTSRIRMKDNDGKTRYLNADEVSNEISMSQEFLNDACKQY